MLVLDGVFLNPLGLAALAAAIPLILLYLLRPEPTRIDLPTVDFLVGDEDEESRNIVIERLRRDPLLLIQLLVVVLIAVTLATPYVTVAERTTIDETVIVVDASASMATLDGGTERFEQAISAAQRELTGTTTLVIAGATPRILLRRAPEPEADQALGDLRVTHSPGQLDEAIDTATTVAGEDARLIIISDFAGESSWQSAIDAARAQGYRVDLTPITGGQNAAGIVGIDFAGQNVSVSVKNLADSPLDRTLTLGDQTANLRLEPGDVVVEEFTIPPNGGDIRLGPTDAFPVDDIVPIATPTNPTVEVVVVTNDENEFLTTALSLIDEVEVTIREPPTTLSDDYDIIVFSNVDPDRLLQGNVQTARETLERGGGVVIQAQPGVGTFGYGDLLPIEPAGLGNGTTVSVANDPVTSGISFSPPEQYVRGELRTGRALVRVNDEPLIVTGTYATGRVLYYGYIEEASAFKYNYQYPVFWQRAIRHVIGRATLDQLNRRTGTRLSFGSPTAVEGPTGSEETTTLRLDRVGRYRVGEQRYAAGLLRESASNVTAKQPTTAGGEAVDGSDTEERMVPWDVSHFVVVGILVFVGMELVVLRRRGDL